MVSQEEKKWSRMCYQVSSDCVLYKFTAHKVKLSQKNIFSFPESRVAHHIRASVFITLQKNYESSALMAECLQSNNDVANLGYRYKLILFHVYRSFYVNLTFLT